MLDTIDFTDATPTLDGIILQAGPFGFSCLTAKKEAERIFHADPKRAWIHMEWPGPRSQDPPILVAFASEATRSLYLAFKAIPKVGRKTALGCLEVDEMLDVLRAIAGSDIKYLVEVLPGVGDGKAEAMVKTMRKKYSTHLPNPVPVSMLEWSKAREFLMGDDLSQDNLLAVEDLLMRSAATGAQSARDLVLASRKITSDAS